MIAANVDDFGFNVSAAQPHWVLFLIWAGRMAILRLLAADAVLLHTKIVSGKIVNLSVDGAAVS
jgi:hypothetical protein